VRLVPASEAGRYFGLMALFGKVTFFLAPLCVAFATGVFETQAAAPVALILFFAAGLTLLGRCVEPDDSHLQETVTAVPAAVTMSMLSPWPTAP
jgi:MFS-type transporter involved in bile tolerance (Atg22 family)